MLIAQQRFYGKLLLENFTTPSPHSILSRLLEKSYSFFPMGNHGREREILSIILWGNLFITELGGSGLKRIREISLSLLCKWFSRLKNDWIWVRLLKEKYGVEVGNFLQKM